MIVRLGRRAELSLPPQGAPPKAGTAEVATDQTGDEPGRSKKSMWQFFQDLIEGKRASEAALVKRNPSNARARARLELLNELHGRLRQVQLGQHRREA